MQRTLQIATKRLRLAVTGAALLLAGCAPLHVCALEDRGQVPLGPGEAFAAELRELGLDHIVADPGSTRLSVSADRPDYRRVARVLGDHATFGGIEVIRIGSRFRHPGALDLAEFQAAGSSRRAWILTGDEDGLTAAAATIASFPDLAERSARVGPCLLVAGTRSDDDHIANAVDSAEDTIEAEAADFGIPYEVTTELGLTRALTDRGREVMREKVDAAARLSFEAHGEPVVETLQRVGRLCDLPISAAVASEARLWASIEDRSCNLAIEAITEALDLGIVAFDDRMLFVEDAEYESYLRRSQRRARIALDLEIFVLDPALVAASLIVAPGLVDEMGGVGGEGSHLVVRGFEAELADLWSWLQTVSSVCTPDVAARRIRDEREPIEMEDSLLERSAPSDAPPR